MKKIKFTLTAVAAMFAVAAIAIPGSAVPSGLEARTEARIFTGADGSVFRYRWAEKLPNDWTQGRDGISHAARPSDTTNKGEKTCRRA